MKKISRIVVVGIVIVAVALTVIYSSVLVSFEHMIGAAKGESISIESIVEIQAGEETKKAQPIALNVDNDVAGKIMKILTSVKYTNDLGNILGIYKKGHSSDKSECIEMTFALGEEQFSHITISPDGSVHVVHYESKGSRLYHSHDKELYQKITEQGSLKGRQK